jgi:hypothetical protein
MNVVKRQQQRKANHSTKSDPKAKAEMAAYRDYGNSRKKFLKCRKISYE